MNEIEERKEGEVHWLCCFPKEGRIAGGSPRVVEDDVADGERDGSVDCFTF